MKKNNIVQIPSSVGIDLATLEKMALIFGISLYRINLKTRDVSLNLNTTKIAGYDYDDLPRSLNSKEAMIHSEDLKLVNDSFASILSGQSSYYHIQYRMLRKDSSIAWVEEIGLVSDYDKDGAPLYVSAMAMDLSRLKWAEEKTLRIEKELWQISSQSSDVLMEENRLLRAASAAGTMIVGGFHSDYEVTLHQAIQLIGESLQANYVGIWRNANRDGKMSCFLRSHWTRRGHSLGKKDEITYLNYEDFLPNWEECLSEGKYVALKASKFYREFLASYNIIDESTDISSNNIMLIPFHLNGEFWGMIGFCREGDRPFLEYEARTITMGTGVIAYSISRNETLGKINLDREQAIANTLAKGEFLSRMSHELRTPLNAIINMTNFALREKDYQKAIEHIQKANASSQLLLNVINDILDISKIEAGKFEFVKEPFDFEKMLKNAENIVRVNMETKHQKFIVVFKNEMKNLIISDEHRILQVVVNLLNNAMKFTPEQGSITLTTSYREIDEKIIRIRVEVTDTGIGISYDQQKKLFHIFEQVDGSITRKYGGSGLGLAICKKILNSLNGDIWVKSKPNQGSCFYFEFDAEIGESINNVNDEYDAKAVDNAALANFRGLTFLIVEDVEINREIIEIMLSDTGVQIENAENGKIALEMFIKNPLAYDLILMDVQMPVMDGLTATKEIRKSGAPSALTIPIVAMTANAFKEDVEMCLDAGMNDHIGKPINMDQAIETIKKYLKPR